MDHRSNPDEHDDDNARSIRRLQQSKKEFLEQIAQREVAYKTEVSRRKAVHKHVLAQIEQEYADDLQDLEQEYTDDLQDLVGQVRKLNGDLNAFLPISRLPAEILSHIFLAFTIDYWAGFMNRAENTGHLFHLIRHAPCHKYPWRMLQHICTRWRDIVLRTPSLFTWIIPDRLDVVKFEIQKSGALPLDIIGFSWGKDNVADCVLSVLPRARSLVMALFSTTLDSMRPGNIGPIHAPHLVSIDYDIELAPDYRRAIPTLSELDAPNLTSLTTRGGSLELLKTFTRPTLTSLCMTYWSQQNWAATDLLQLLGSLPALRALSLCLSARDTVIYTPASTPMKHITLPCLISLVIHSETGSDGLAQFLDHVTCPSLTTLRYWPGLSQNMIQDVLMTTMQTKMRTTALCNSFLLRTIGIVGQPGSRDVNLGVWDSEQSDVSMLQSTSYNSDHFQNTAGSFVASRISNMEFVVEMFLPMFNLSHVTTIHLEYNLSHTPSVVWRGLFHATPAVCMLRAPLPGLADILDVSKTAGQESPILPRLRVLDLRDTHRYRQHDPHLMDSFVACLQFRRTVVGSLDRFQIPAWWSNWGAHTPKSLIEAKVVRVVEYDNREYSADEI